MMRSGCFGRSGNRRDAPTRRDRASRSPKSCRPAPGCNSATSARARHRRPSRRCRSSCALVATSFRRDDAYVSWGHDAGLVSDCPEHAGTRLSFPSSTSSFNKIAHMLRAFLPVPMLTSMSSGLVTHVLGNRLDCAHRAALEMPMPCFFISRVKRSRPICKIVERLRLAEESAIFVARRGRLHDVQPVARRRGALP